MMTFWTLVVDAVGSLSLITEQRNPVFPRREGRTEMTSNPSMAVQGLVCGDSLGRARRMIECGKQDLNLHGVNPHQALNLARLPIPPFPQSSFRSV